MKKRNLFLFCIGCVVLMSVIACPFLMFNSAARHAVYAALGKTGSATLVYEDATLVVVPFPIDPARNDVGTTYQAVGVLVPHTDGYELKSLATNASVVVEQNGPLAISQDRAYLQVGAQQLQLSTWALVEPGDRGWEPLREDVDTTMSSDSRNSNVFFKIRSSVEGYPLLRGDWRIDTRVLPGPNHTLYYGLGEVQQAGWGPDQQTIYIANDGRILTISINQGAVR